MKTITLENVSNFIGKTVDCSRRLLHYYPITIGQNSKGKYYFRDRTGTYQFFDKDTNIRYDIVNGNCV